MFHRRFLRTFATVTLVSMTSSGVAFPAACGGGGSGSSGGGCITTLPVTVQFPSPFAGAYKRTVPVIVVTQGPPIRNLTATLYTFGGVKIASGSFKATIFSSNQLKLQLQKGFRPMQAGAFTLALFGEPNADPSCGPKHTYKVVHFLPCLTTLPVTFPNPPGGKASDYSGSLSVNVQSKGFVLGDVNVSLSTFSGTALGSRSFKTVFGEVTATFNLPGGVQPGGYTLFVSGGVQGMPASCGAKTAKTVLTFT